MQYINIVTLAFTLLALYKYSCYIKNVRQNDYPLPPKQWNTNTKFLYHTQSTTTALYVMPAAM